MQTTYSTSKPAALQWWTLWCNKWT